MFGLPVVGTFGDVMPPCPDMPSGWRVRTPQKSMAADSSMACDIENGPVEIVDLLMKNGYVPYSYVSLPKGI